MSDSTKKSGSKHTRKPLKHLTKSQANRTMSSTSTPLLEHSQMIHPPAPPAPIEDNDQLLEPRTFPDGFNRRRLYTEFNGAGQPNHFGPTNTQVSYPQASYYGYFKTEDESVPQGAHGGRYYEPGSSEVTYPQWVYPPPSEHHGLIQQDRKRFKTENGHVEVCKPRLEDPRKLTSSNQTHLLWIPEDEQHLTDLHCFIRKRCVFIFSATNQDVKSKPSSNGACDNTSPSFSHLTYPVSVSLI